MPRPRRVQFAGALYYITNRERHRIAIFSNDAEKLSFIENLGRASLKSGWKVDAYALTTSRYHLLLTTPEPNLVAGLRWLLGVHALRSRQQRDHRGHLFGGRYRAVLVDAASPSHHDRALLYTLLSPAREGMLATGTLLRDYPWTSLSAALRPARAPAWLHVDRIQLNEGAAGSRGDGGALEQRLEVCRNDPAGMAEPGLRRGWVFGSATFRESAEHRVRSAVDAPPGGARHLPLDFDATRAEAIVQEELGRAGWTEVLLQETLKNHPRKVAIAGRVRSETTASLQWVAARLRMGSWTHTANSIYRAQRSAQEERRSAGGTNLKAAHRMNAALKDPEPTVSNDPSAVKHVTSILEELPAHCL